jgi:hypothetical protein
MKIDIKETDQKKIQSVIEGLVTRAYQNMAFLDEDDQAAGLRMLARQYNTYMSKTYDRQIPSVSPLKTRKRKLEPLAQS